MIRLTVETFDPGAALNRFSAGRNATGAVASFLGIARGEPGQETALELEAYPGFTDAEIVTAISNTVLAPAAYSQV